MVCARVTSGETVTLNPPSSTKELEFESIMEDDDDLDQDFLNMCGNIANNDEFMSNDELLYEFQTAADIVAEPPVIPSAAELSKRRKRDDGALSSPIPSTE